MRTKAIVALASMLGVVGAVAMACSSTTTEETPACDPATDPACVADGGDVDGGGDASADGVTPGDGTAGDGTAGDAPVDGAKSDATATDSGVVVLPDGSVIHPDGAITYPDGAVVTDVGPLPPCVAGGTQCTNCIDDDKDGLIDWLDPECTGPLDDDEDSFATGIPGDNIDPCKQDCWFDGNSGAGDDKCDFDARCLYGSKDPKCPYDATMASDPTKCPPPSAACKKFCMPLVPKGCDCAGCCDVYKDGKVYTVKLTSECTYEKLGTASCPTCKKIPDCSVPCGKCEWCLGKTSLPPECYPPPADAGVPDGSTTDGSTTDGSTTDGSTTPDAGTDSAPPPPTCSGGAAACSPTMPCATGYYCLTGCCIKAPA